MYDITCLHLSKHITPHGQAASGSAAMKDPSATFLHLIDLPDSEVLHNFVLSLVNQQEYICF